MYRPYIYIGIVLLTLPVVWLALEMLGVVSFVGRVLRKLESKLCSRLPKHSLS